MLPWQWGVLVLLNEPESIVVENNASLKALWIKNQQNALNGGILDNMQLRHILVIARPGGIYSPTGV